MTKSKILADADRFMRYAREAQSRGDNILAYSWSYKAAALYITARHFFADRNNELVDRVVDAELLRDISAARRDEADALAA